MRMSSAGTPGPPHNMLFYMRVNVLEQTPQDEQLQTYIWWMRLELPTEILDFRGQEIQA